MPTKQLLASTFIVVTRGYNAVARKTVGFMTGQTLKKNSFSNSSVEGFDRARAMIAFSSINFLPGPNDLGLVAPILIPRLVTWYIGSPDLSALLNRELQRRGIFVH